MFRIGLVLGVVAALVLPSGAVASQSAKGTLVEYSSPLLPPSQFNGQWWTSPDNCRYSRAGRPGETVWYLIVNNAHTKCPSRLIQRAYSDYD